MAWWSLGRDPGGQPYAVDEVWQSNRGLKAAAAIEGAAGSLAT